MKERLTITLNSDILKRVDAAIQWPIKSRSEAIEQLLIRSLQQRLPKKAVILCGGEGTRMRPITYEIPKPLIPVNGIPVAAHLIELFKRFGVTEIILTTCYKKDLVKQHFGDGSKYGVRVTYLEEDNPLKTAGFLSALKGKLEEPIFVTNGDELKDVNLEEMYATHKANKAACTIALTSVSNPSHYGVAELSGSKIDRFVEKPENPKSNFINAGLYIIEPSVVNSVPEGVVTFEKDIFPRIAASGKLIAYPFTGKWFDCGTIDRYETALKEWD